MDLYRLFTILIVTIVISRPVIVNAEADYLLNLQQAAKGEQLWQQQEWLNLVHYHKSWFPGGSYSSYVDDERFFISSKGKDDPEAELLATLAAFFQENISDNEHARCRFTARYRWLKEHLLIDERRLPAVICSEYLKWRTTIRAERATLIFPAYYLNSPSSMFGHTLLRLDPNPESEWPELLSFAVNFGADVTEQDNSILYAYKGLTGGYPGSFVVMPYFKKIKEYGRIENRDIWEYRLNLTPKEVDRLVTHLWELKEINFDYLFISENCSYRLLELLEVARPSVELTDDFTYVAAPVDTVRSVKRAGLIEEAGYRPAQETELRYLIGQISSQDKKLLTQLIEDPSQIDHDSFSRLPEKQQKLFAEIAYKLVRYRQIGKARDETAAKRSYELLTLVNSYPEGESPEIPVTARPENGHHTKRIKLMYGERGNKNYADLGFRFAYHSLEDDEYGYLRGAQINIGNIRFRRYESGTISLQRLDLVDIFSLTPRNRFFKPLSWRVIGGMERQFLNGQDRLVAQVTGGAGTSWNLLQDGQFYSLLTYRIEGNGVFKYKVDNALGVSLGGLYYWRIGTSHLKLGGERFIHGEHRLKLSFEQNINLARDHSIRFSARREWYSQANITELALSYHYHF